MKKVKFFYIHCSQIFETALLFGGSCTVNVVPSESEHWWNDTDGEQPIEGRNSLKYYIKL